MIGMATMKIYLIIAKMKMRGMSGVGIKSVSVRAMNLKNNAELDIRE